MKLSLDSVDKLAHLARLEFDYTTRQQMLDDMNQMLAFVEQLNEMDTEGVEPLIYMTDDVNIYRDDKVENQISKEDALRNVPKKDSDYVRVTKVLKSK